MKVSRWRMLSASVVAWFVVSWVSYGATIVVDSATSLPLSSNIDIFCLFDLSVHHLDQPGTIINSATLDISTSSVDTDADIPSNYQTGSYTTGFDYYSYNAMLTDILTGENNSVSATVSGGTSQVTLALSSVGGFSYLQDDGYSFTIDLSEVGSWQQYYLGNSTRSVQTGQRWVSTGWGGGYYVPIYSTVRDDYFEYRPVPLSGSLDLSSAQLTIGYTSIPEPSMLGLLALGSLGVVAGCRIFNGRAREQALEG